MTMFPINMPQMPPEVLDAVMANPQGFADAMGSGMEAFSAAMEGGGGMEAAFEAFGDAAGPMMGELGISQEVFDAVGDMVGAACGPAIMMGPADAGGADMGAMMADGISMMCPEGTDMPPEVTDACTDMGNTFADTGCEPHQVAGEMMPPPGDPGHPMPMDANGDPMMVPGDPSSVPADCVQDPPPNGECAGNPGLMPPAGGHDHPPMGDGMTVPPAMTLQDAVEANTGQDDGGAGAMGSALGDLETGGTEPMPIDPVAEAAQQDVAETSFAGGSPNEGGDTATLAGMADADAAAETAADADAAAAADGCDDDATSGMG